MKKVLETERLILRELNVEDAAFILTLLNTPTWLKYIGDRNVYDLESAEHYLINGPQKSYQENGFGLYLMELKHDNIKIGLCGLIKRDYLEGIDIGFALMPEFFGKGFAYEAAFATVQFAFGKLAAKRLLAITLPENQSSINLLKKIGLHFEKMITDPNGEELMLFSGVAPISK